MEKTKEHQATREMQAAAKAPVHEPLAKQHLPSGRMGWVLGIGAGLAVGFVGAAQSIRNKFYEDTKSWKTIPELRENRATEFEKINGTEQNPQTFKIFDKETQRIERDFTSQFNKRIHAMSGIEMGGWRGLTIGTWQRFKVAGFPTKLTAGLSMITAAAVATSAIFSFEARRRVIDLSDKLEEKGHGM